MSEQLYYESVDIDSHVGSLRKHPTSRQLVKWAGAVDDYYEAHYDKDFALKQGLPGVIVFGMQGVAFLGQLMTDWIGDRGTLKKLNCRYKGLFFPDEDLLCKGRVKNKSVEENEYRVECEVWLENPRGEKVIHGSAMVALPSRG